MSAPSPAPTLKARLLALAGVGAPSLLFFLQLCDLIYDCGCRALWNGAADGCNVHAPEPPHCPWCATGLWGSLVPVGLMLSTQAACLLTARRRLAPRIALAAACFPLAGGVAGLAFGWWTGYWS